MAKKRRKKRRRRATGETSAAPVGEARKTRRRFGGEQKASIIAEYSAAPRGTKDQVLKKYGIYPNQISQWRKQVDIELLAAARAPDQLSAANQPKPERAMSAKSQDDKVVVQEIRITGGEIPVPFRVEDILAENRILNGTGNSPKERREESRSVDEGGFAWIIVNFGMNHRRLADFDLYKLIEKELGARRHGATAVFGMPCYWSGEVKFGGIEGTPEIGFRQKGQRAKSSTLTTYPFKPKKGCEPVSDPQPKSLPHSPPRSY